MKHIEIINGPNLNLTGIREPEVYGSTTMEEYIGSLRKQFLDVEISYYQSNVEGELIDRIQQVGFRYDGIIVNLGGYSHTSVALRDALLAVPGTNICSFKNFFGMTLIYRLKDKVTIPIELLVGFLAFLHSIANLRSCWMGGHELEPLLAEIVLGIDHLV